VARLVVLAAIELDDDAAVETDEIDDVVPQWNLSPKLEAGEATAAEFAPDEYLGLGLAPAKVFGATAVVGHGCHGTSQQRQLRERPPHPRPLSRGGIGIYTSFVFRHGLVNSDRMESVFRRWNGGFSVGTRRS